MKFIKLIVVFQLVALVFVSCSKEENGTLDTQMDTTAEVIVSPNGIQMATSMNAVKAIIQPSVDALFSANTSFDIVSHKFVESRLKTAMILDVRTTGGFERRLIYVKERAGGNLRHEDKCYTITCSGDCENPCSPSATISEGQVTTACNASGCSCEMTIREHACGDK